MIPIQLQPEPDYFDIEIRKKGNISLQQNKEPLNEFFNLSKNQHWTKCHKQEPTLHKIYNGICAYYGCYFDDCTGSVTVDHFKPKAKYPNLAYEWNNYRLACSKANSCKSDFEDVLDPAVLKEHIFYMDKATGKVFIKSDIDEELYLQAQATINRLKLNDDKLCKKRINDLANLIDKNLYTESYLARTNPFVYAEAKRQGLIK